MASLFVSNGDLIQRVICPRCRTYGIHNSQRMSTFVSFLSTRGIDGRVKGLFMSLR